MLHSLLHAVREHSRLSLQLMATGSHLLRSFGLTVRQIENDGFPIAARVRLQTGSDDASREAEGVGRAVTAIARELRRLDPDVAVVLGDRVEAMAAAVATVCSRRILAHIHGGDVAPGDLDDSLRHAISKLAHLHFPATRQSANRLTRMGEDPRRIHVVGSLAIDELRAIAPPPPHVMRSQLLVPENRDYALVVLHSIGDEPHREQRRMEAALTAVCACGLWPVVIYPNSDPGHSGIIKAITQFEKRKQASVYRSLSRPDYLWALITARVLVGNSSSGIIESAAAGTAAVNIGPRQQGRQRCGRCVIDSSYHRQAIREAIERALRKRPRRVANGVYGDGRAGQRIANHLDRLGDAKSLRHKQIRY